MKNIPYTYLIYCIPTQQYYYGVRYSKNCCPDDLWKSYFTSSKYVKNLILEYGKENFKHEIRKTFSTTYAARQWEKKVLIKMNVVERKDFINKTNTSLITGKNRIWLTNGQENAFVDILDEYDYVGWKRGRTFSEKHKEKISNTRMKQNIINKPNHTSEQKQKWSNQRSGRINGRNTSKSVIIHDIKYETIKDAMIATGLSRFKIVNHFL